MTNLNMVKITVNIEKEYFEQLKDMVADEMIGSMTDGINQAIDLLIKYKYKERYVKLMETAMDDEDFKRRTMEYSNDFEIREIGGNDKW